MTRADRWILASLLLVALVGTPLSLASAGARSDTAVVLGPYGETRVSLDEDGRFSVRGAEGVVTFEVASGQMRCVSADCPDGVCLRQGHVGPGRPVVCAPNRVIAAMDATPDGDYDAVSR